VVVPRHGVFPELIDCTGGGVLCEPEDPVDLARALRELLGHDEERLRLGRQGRDSVLEHFSAERMARETLEVYREIRAST
jgi:glycosyltransferase involved in cell wall biosynthesis